MHVKTRVLWLEDQLLVEYIQISLFAHTLGAWIFNLNNEPTKECIIKTSSVIKLSYTLYHLSKVLHHGGQLATKLTRSFTHKRIYWHLND